MFPCKPVCAGRERTPDAFLVSYKLHKKIVSATADQIDIGLLFWSWQNYNGGVAFECVLPNSNTSPMVTTSSITQVTVTTATSGGNVTDDGGSTVTAKGICWSTAFKVSYSLSNLSRPVCHCSLVKT